MYLLISTYLKGASVFVVYFELRRYRVALTSNKAKGGGFASGFNHRAMLKKELLRRHMSLSYPTMISPLSSSWDSHTLCSVEKYETTDTHLEI